MSCIESARVGARKMKKKSRKVVLVVLSVLVVLGVGYFGAIAAIGTLIFMAPAEAGFFALKRESANPAPPNRYLLDQGVFFKKGFNREGRVSLAIISEAGHAPHILSDIDRYAWHESEYDTLYLKSGIVYYQFDIVTHELLVIDRDDFDALGLPLYAVYQSIAN
jgi:hypothetical protein